MKGIALRIPSVYAFAMIDPNDKQETARLSLQMARKTRDVQEMAADLKLSRNAFGKFLKGMKLSDEVFSRVERYAQESGYWLPDLFPHARPDNAWKETADDLISVGNLLLSARSDDIKVLNLTLLTNHLQSAVKSHASKREK